MYKELTNLLPPERKKEFLHEYVLRIGVVSIVLVTALVFIAAVLLLPTYVFLTKSIGTKETRLAAIDVALSSSDEAALSMRLTALARDAAILTALAGTPSPSGIIYAVLPIPHPDIILSGFAYTPAANKVPGTLIISGTAKTRDTLRNYQLALQKASLVRSADVPVSAYAKDSNITFAISITLAP